MYISNQNCEESWDYNDVEKVKRLYYRIKELFLNPNFCSSEEKTEILEVILTEKDGYICVIQKDKTYYSLQIEYDLQLLKAEVQKFNKTPLHYAFMDDSFSGMVTFHFIKNCTRNNERELTTYGSDLEI